MRILFIHSNIDTFVLPHFVPGIASIAAVLKQAGHHSSFMILQEEMSQDAFLTKIDNFSPDIIGFSTMSNQWMIIRKYTQWIKSSRTIPIIHGGIHVTVVPDESITAPEIDLICLGEGEYAMLDLVTRLEQQQSIDDIPNLWIKKADGTILKNEMRPLIADLDALPFAEREMFDYRTMLKENPLNATLFMAGRGCPFRCRYCVNHVLQNRYRGLGKYVRMRSIAHVMEELRFLKQEYGLKEILIYDDTFTFDHRWLREFCEAYKKEINIPFTVNIRVDTINVDILEMMYDAGCERMIAGVESGSERVRTEILGRKMSNESIIQIYQKADALGMKTTAYFMVGLPTETPEEAEESITLCEIIRPNYSQFTVFYPFPGTELYYLCKEKGYLVEGESTNIFENHQLLNLPTFSREAISAASERFWGIGNRIRAAKERKGMLDFLVDFDHATITADKGYVKFTDITVKGDTRLCLFAHPESQISYPIDLPKHAGLAFGITLSPQAWDPSKGQGVVFKIIFENAKGKHILFSRYLDPKNNPEDRSWHDIDIAFTKEMSGKGILHFITTTLGQPAFYAWANWSRPYIYLPALAGERS